MTTTDNTRRRRRWVVPGLGWQAGLVLAMIVVLLGLTALVGRPLLDVPTLSGAVRLPWWLLAVGFAATEACVLHIQIKREAQTISISELPLVLGLFFASPVQLLAGRLVGTAAILVFYRRSSPLKTVWNLAAVTLQTAVAVTVFHLIAGAHAPTHPLTWVAAFAGTMAANSVSSLALALVVSIYEGGLSPLALARAVVTGEQAAPLVITFSLIAVGALTLSPS